MGFIPLAGKIDAHAISILFVFFGAVGLLQLLDKFHHGEDPLFIQYFRFHHNEKHVIIQRGQRKKEKRKQVASLIQQISH